MHTHTIATGRSGEMDGWDGWSCSDSSSMIAAHYYRHWQLAGESKSYLCRARKTEEMGVRR